MKCSLLTLSSFVDDELEVRKRGELEAHLVGCQRCRSAAEHLREEMARVGGLARVHITDHSVAALLKQFGLIKEGAVLPPRTNIAEVATADTGIPPWFGTDVGTALPWRADAPRSERIPEPSVSLGGVPWRPPPPSVSVQGRGSWEGGTPACSPAASASSDDSGDASVERPESVPPPTEDTPAAVDVYPPPPPPLVPSPPPEKEAAAFMPIPMLPPTDLSEVDNLEPIDSASPTRHFPARVAASRLGFIASIRERIALHRALHLPSSEFDDSVEIVSGTGAPLRSERAWERQNPTPNIQPQDTYPDEVNVIGSAQTPSTALPTTWQVPSIAPPAPEPNTDGNEASDYYAGDAADELPAPVAHFPSDAVYTRVADVEPLPMPREEPPYRRGVVDQLKTWFSSRHISWSTPNWLATAPATVARRLMPLLQRRPRGFRMDRRAFGAIAVAMALLVVGLATGRQVSSTAPSAKPVTPPVTSTPKPTPEQPQAHSQPAATSAPSTAMTIQKPISLGDGGTGVQLTAIRYGIHPGDFRIVFDLTGSTSPKTVVGFLDDQTLVVVLDGTASGDNLGSLPSTSTVTSVTRLQSATQGQTVIQFKLAHPVTPAQFYMTSPLRLVLDLS